MVFPEPLKKRAALRADACEILVYGRIAPHLVEELRGYRPARAPLLVFTVPCDPRFEGGALREEVLLVPLRVHRTRS